MLTTLAALISRDRMHWIRYDPVGQKVALAAIVIVGLIAIIVAVNSIRWAAARAGLLIGLAILAALVFYGSVLLFHLGPVGWIAAAVIAFGMFLGLALFLTVARR